MNWYRWLIGYLEIALYGEYPERVINMAMSRGIQMWDIRQHEQGFFMIKIRLGGLKALRHLVRRCGCRLKITRRKGLPVIVMRAQKRKVLVLGLFFFLATLYILSSFVWFINVAGNEEISQEKILEQVEKYGLKIGVPKAGIDQDIIQKKLLLDIPELSWCSVQIEGTKVKIEIAEKTGLLASEERETADIIARAEGKIAELLVLKGTSLVHEGEQVQKGQTLISGLIYPQIQINQDGTVTPSGIPQRVRARGLIRAHVVHTQIGMCFLKEEKDLDTGNETTVVLLRFRGREVIIKGPKTIPYERYRKVTQTKTLVGGRNPEWIVELVTTVYIEQQHFTNEWGLEGAYQEAVKRAKNKVLENLPDDYRIIAERHQPVSPEKKDVVYAKYVLETIEDIGIYPGKRSN